MAESGLTLVQIKSVTGHNSDTVVQGYIENTERLRRTSSETLQFGTNNDKESSDRNVRQKTSVADVDAVINPPLQPQLPILQNIAATNQPAAAMHFHFDFAGANISAPLTIGSLLHPLLSTGGTIAIPTSPTNNP